MILESMKMEIPVESAVSGRIQSILVAPGDAVDEDQDLAIIEID
jgi:biotin carboxyl carrier protein